MTDDQKKPASPSKQQPPTRSPINWMILLLLGFITVLFLTSAFSSQSEISYTRFLKEVAEENILRVTIVGQQVTGEFKKEIILKADSNEKDAQEKQEPMKRFTCNLPAQTGEKWLAELEAKDIEIKAEEATGPEFLFMMISFGGLVLLVLIGWTMIRRSRDQMMGGGMLGSVTKSPARRYDADEHRVVFDDVAGLGGVKKDLQEIVLFLKDAEKFQRLGARVPKGVLLMGPPGTGKTLLARAIAGEASVPFFSINGSEFIQLFVGVGAGRVRDMFKTAQDNSPSILFIDEIDAVGRQRGAGLGGGHDEREQTLNQILSEMDGFSPGSTVIVLAATNRPDVLDPALLRPGRFDRHIMVDRPTIEGRREMFELHSRNVPITEDVDFEVLAKATVGLTGADISNLVNEAALWATRQDHDKVEMSDFEHARDKVLMGAKREEVLSEEEKRITAFHEAGHAILAWLIPGSDRVHKVTIIPRGRALGVTQLVPDEDRHNMGETEMLARLAMMLGGRTAEKLEFDEYSAGAENDLKEATSLARRMVKRWGMSERLGPVAYGNGEEQPFLGRELTHEQRTYSEHTAQVIDEEIARILHEAAEQAEKLLSKHRTDLETISEALLEHEVLNYNEIEALIGPSIHKSEKSSSGSAVDAAAVRAKRDNQHDQNNS